MSPSSTEFKKRVITGIFGVGALVALILWGGWFGICLLTAVISLGMIVEFCALAFDSEERQNHRSLLLFLICGISLINFLIPRLEYELLISSFILLFSYFLFSAKGKSGEILTLHFKELKYSVFGLIYVGFLPLYLTRVHNRPDGVIWTLLFFVMVWATDTFAYFVGIRFGRNKLYPDISPKKSVEGAWGGLLSAVLVAFIFKGLGFKELSWFGAFVMPCVVSVFSQIGDLCESFLKRAYGKKDSGGILPGHGGFLDRFDGVVFSLPVMYACIKLFG